LDSPFPFLLEGHCLRSHPLALAGDGRRTGKNGIAIIPRRRLNSLGVYVIIFAEMGKTALTVLDLILILILVVLALRELLSIQIGVSPYLPRFAQVLGFDAAKVVVFCLCCWGVWYFAKRIRGRFKSA